MLDWEPFNRKKNAADDPWNRPSGWSGETRSSSRVSGAHDPSPGHVIGSCEGETPHTRVSGAGRVKNGAKKKKPANPGLLVALVILVIWILFNVGVTLVSELVEDGLFATITESDGDGTADAVNDDSTGDEGFSKDAEDESADTSADTGSSDITLYTGTTDFTLELQSCEGLEALSYQEIYATVLQSVVTITVYSETSGGCATGVILTSDGYILTNQHVIDGESYASVTTYDDITYEATLVGEDANTDLAILKIEAEGLVPAVFGDSEELTVGDECFAIGNPLGVTYRNTFTNGIISALNRSVTVNDYSMKLIQTTAALNSGNSGGPLINIYGQIVGINNMKVISTETTVEGLGFAIPATTVCRVVNSLLASGSVEHPVIGITCYSVSGTDDDGNAITGLYVVTVNAASDALQQGLWVGDIITALNGEDIASVSDIDLTQFHVGDEISVTVYRDGEWLEITFALVEQNDLE